MELTTELGMILPLVPAFIVGLTEAIKGNVPKPYIWTIPYIISATAFLGLRVVFNGDSLGVYLVNSVVFAFGGTKAYDAATRKKENKNDIETIEYDIDLDDTVESIHDTRSIKFGG